MPSPTFATLALGILASVPVTLLIWAITAAVWARFGRPRLDLTTAIFEHPDPATEADRLRTTGNMLAVATGVAVVTFVALGLAAHAGERADAWLLIAAPVAASGVGLGVLMVWPLPSRPGVGVISWRDAAPAPLVGTLGVLAVLSVAGLVAAGFASASDPDGGGYTALGMPSVLDWTIGAGGEPVEIEYAPGMVTRPFPGWTYGVPIIGGILIVCALGIAVIARLVDPKGAYGDPSLVGAYLRIHVGIVATCLATAATAFLAGGASFFAGTAYAAASLTPLRQELAGGDRPFTYAEPLHTAALVLQYAGVALVIGSTLAIGFAAAASRDVVRARHRVHALPRV